MRSWGMNESAPEPIDKVHIFMSSSWYQWRQHPPIRTPGNGLGVIGVFRGRQHHGELRVNGDEPQHLRTSVTRSHVRRNVGKGHVDGVRLGTN